MKTLKFIQTFAAAAVLTAYFGGFAFGKSTFTRDATPVIYNYIDNSDYVVLAKPETAVAVAKFGKKESQNLQDLMAGLLHTLKIEKTLYGKDSSKLPEALQVVVEMSERMNEYYEKGQKYLIFLRRIPKAENLASVYELEKDKTYFRAFEGETSIFPHTGGFHGPPKKGIINFNDARYQDLIKRIETLTAALDAEDNDTKIKNLQKLASSSDEEVKNNATYAIKTLEKPKN